MLDFWGVPFPTEFASQKQKDTGHRMTPWHFHRHCKAQDLFWAFSRRAVPCWGTFFCLVTAWQWNIPMFPIGHISSKGPHVPYCYISLYTRVSKYPIPPKHAHINRANRAKLTMTFAIFFLITPIYGEFVDPNYR